MKNTVLTLLESSVSKYPNKVAFNDNQGTLTFTQVMDLGKKMGSYLTTITKPKAPIIIFMEKNRYVPACFMGVVYAGCFYVPIDTSLPIKRLNTIIDTVEAPLLICDTASMSTVEKLNFKGKVLNADDGFNYDINENSLDMVRHQAMDTDPLYVVFTSGSTGVPKGVVTSHKSVHDLMDAMADAFDINENDIIGNQAPFDYDGSVKDIYNTLRTGATTFIIPREYFAQPQYLIDAMNEHKVSVIFWAVSAMMLPVNLNAFDYDTPKSLRYALFSGAVMPSNVLIKWQEACPNTTFVNLYGPTETTCNCTYHIVDHKIKAGETLSIGKPFLNTGIILLNKDGSATSKNEIGEICVSGSCLTSGYYKNPEKTSEVYIQNPLNAAYPEVIYKTGDLGSYAEDGTLNFHGREDSQIKHMGHRIELGEIETALGSKPSIKDVCCMYDEENKKICLFFVSDEEDKRSIAVFLREELPKFMLPSKFFKLDCFPRKLNGKVDRQELKKKISE